MRDIHCSQCGKFLFSTDKSDGAAAAEARVDKMLEDLKTPSLF